VDVLCFRAPTSVDEAVAALRSEPDAFTLGGGTDLLVQMRSGLRRPRTVVDIKRIPALSGIRIGPESVSIGAATPCAVIARHTELASLWPGVVEAAGLIGSKQVQGRASLGGNLCNASPAADSVPALVASRARVRVAGPDGERWLPVEEVTSGPGRTVLGKGEFVVAFELPLPATRQADAYLRFIPRTEMDIAVVGAAAAIRLDASGRCEEARIALGAVAPTVIRVPEAEAAVVGSVLGEPELTACVAAARAACSPISDKRGTADFRRHVAGVLVQRAVLEAARRAAARGG
jgi:carbon-monoxide dehydrogenase medium subunit